MECNDYFTIKDLRKAIKGLPGDMPVYYQRIHDAYFITHKWSETSKKLQFEGDEEPDEYVSVFTAYRHPDDDVFVLNAHY